MWIVRNTGTWKKLTDCKIIEVFVNAVEKVCEEPVKLIKHYLIICWNHAASWVMTIWLEAAIKASHKQSSSMEKVKHMREKETTLCLRWILCHWYILKTTQPDNFWKNKHPNSRFGSFLCPSGAKGWSQGSISACSICNCNETLKFCTDALIPTKNLKMTIEFPKFQI